MSPAVADAVYGHLADAITAPGMRELFSKGGAEISAMPPAEMAREAKRLSDYWGAVIREIGVRLDS